MNLYNNTPGEVFYGIGTEGGGDCGTIDAGDTASLPAYDNQTNVTVEFSGQPAGAPLKVTYNDTGVGKVVTVGIYHE